MSDGMTEMAREERLNKQVGGDHYRKYAIQPAEFSARNNLSFLAGNVVKYVTRYRDKGGAEDIYKAIHYLELILEFEYPALLANNSECKTAVKAPGAAIEPSPATLSPHLAAEAEDTTLYATPSGPELILKLESTDPDQIGELYGSVREHQKRGHASGSGQETRRPDYTTGYQDGSQERASRSQTGELRPYGEKTL